MIGIYKITSPTGKVYIGQSWNIHKRFIQYKNLHCADQPRLYNSLKKHGALCHSFDVVHELPPDIHQNLMDRYEHLYMDLYRASGIDMLNLREAGSNGKLSEETKKKISSANKGRPGVNKGCKLKPETIIKLKEARKKQVFSDKDKRKISDSLKKHFKLYPQIVFIFPDEFVGGFSSSYSCAIYRLPTDAKLYARHLYCFVFLNKNIIKRILKNRPCPAIIRPNSFPF